MSVLPLLGNDTLDSNGANATDAPNVSVAPNGAITCEDCDGPPAPLVLNGDGTVTVPSGATPGTYLVPYQICALPANPSPLENACDTAIATVVVGAEPVPGLSVLALAFLSLLLVAIGWTRTRRDF